MTNKISITDTPSQPVPSIEVTSVQDDWVGIYYDLYRDNVTVPGDELHNPYEINGYPYPSMHSWRHIIAAAVVVATIMLVIVAGNTLVIVAIAVDRNLKGLQNWFIASLAVSDLFVGSFIMPLSLANELMGYWAFGDVLCQLWLSTDVLLCTASILNLVLISLDRYWSITRAVAYVRARTKRRAVVLIATVWLVSMVICLPPLFGWKSPQPTKFGYPLCVLSEEPGYVLYSTVGSFYLPLVVMILVYFKIYLAARRHARRNLKKPQGTNNGKPLATTAGGLKTTERDNNLVEHHQNAKASPGKETSSDLDLSDYYPNRESPKAASHAEEEEDYDVKNDCGIRSAIPLPDNEVTSGSGCISSVNWPSQILSQRNLLFVTDVDNSTSDLSPSRSIFDQQHPGRRTESLPEGRLLVSNRSNSFDSTPTEHISSLSEEGILSETSITRAKRGSNHLWQLLPRPTDVLHKSRERHQRSDSNCSDRTGSIGTDINHGGSRQRSLAAVFYFNINMRQRISLPIRRARHTEDPTNNILAQEKFRRRIARAKERRATLVLGIVMASFVGCWLPFFFMYPMTMLAGLHVPDGVFAVIFWLGYVNSALNPIIYTIFNSDFRQAFRRLLFARHTQSF